MAFTILLASRGVWIDPGRHNDEVRRAIAINAMELGIARIGHYCHLTDSEAFFENSIACVVAKKCRCKR